MSAPPVSSLIEALSNSSTSSSSSLFSALLGPSLTPQQFFSRYWEKKPLHIQRNSATYYKGLFSKQTFDQHIKKNAEKLQYGYDLNICVCSKEGKKIDMNPPPEEEEEEQEEQKQNTKMSRKAEAKPAPASNSSKQSSSSKPKSTIKNGVEYMTIADALKLAAAQQQAKKNGGGKLTKAQQQQQEEEEEEDEDDEDEPMDEEEAYGESDGDDGPHSEDEEQLDGTSVSTIKRYAPVTFSAYSRLYNSGCTVQALQPQQYTRNMHTLISKLESMFGGLVGANCYLTPPKSQGLAPHHDDVDVFVLQLEGTKTWKLYEPKMSLPREHSGDFARDELEEEPMQIVNLKEGDLMYLPRGVIHEARTSNEASAHMTISVYQKQSWYDLLLALFPRALESAFYSAETEAFRKGLPLNYLSYMGSAQGMELESDSASEGKLSESLSVADPSMSRVQLRANMLHQFTSLMEKLTSIMKEELDPCADGLSQDFMISRLPPVSSTQDDEEAMVALQPHGPQPTMNSKVRITHPEAVRMMIVQDEDDEDENDNEEGDDEEKQQDDDDEEGPDSHILLAHSLGNSTTHHLDGRFPPDETANQLHLPIYYMPTIVQLLRRSAGKQSSSFIPVSSLKLQLEDMVNAEGEEATEEEQQTAKMELVEILWQAGLLEVQQANVKQHDKATNGATSSLEKKNTNSNSAASSSTSSSASRPSKQSQPHQQQQQSQKKRPADEVKSGSRQHKSQQTQQAQSSQKPAPSAAALQNQPLRKKQKVKK